MICLKFKYLLEIEGEIQLEIDMYSLMSAFRLKGFQHSCVTFSPRNFMPFLQEAKLILGVEKQSYRHKILHVLPRQITLQGVGEKERNVGQFRRH